MQEEGIPFDPKGAVIYHCGPVIQDKRVIAAGPTTSARMNELSGFLIDKGVRATHRERRHGHNACGNSSKAGASTSPSPAGVQRLPPLT